MPRHRPPLRVVRAGRVLTLGLTATRRLYSSTGASVGVCGADPTLAGVADFITSDQMQASPNMRCGRMCPCVDPGGPIGRGPRTRQPPPPRDGNTTTRRCSHSVGPGSCASGRSRVPLPHSPPRRWGWSGTVALRYAPEAGRRAPSPACPAPPAPRMADRGVWGPGQTAHTPPGGWRQGSFQQLSTTGGVPPWTPPPPQVVGARFFSGPSANQKFSMAPSAPHHLWGAGGATVSV